MFRILSIVSVVTSVVGLEGVDARSVNLFEFTVTTIDIIRSGFQCWNLRFSVPVICNDDVKNLSRI